MPSKPSTVLATGLPIGPEKPVAVIAAVGLAASTGSGERRAGSGGRPGSRLGLRLGLRFTLLIALLPLLALPWIGLRFVERMAEMSRDAQAETQQAAVRSLAASLHERQELFGLGDPAQLPQGMQAIVPYAHAGGDTAAGAAIAGAVDWSAAPRLTLPVQIEGGAPPQTLRVRMALAVKSGPGPSAAHLLLVEADDERLVLPGDIDTSGRGPVVQPGDQLTVQVGDETQWLEAIGAAQRARTIGSIRIRLPELPQRIPVPLAATAHGWRAELELPQEARLIRISVVDVDYMGSRNVEARADSGLLLIADGIDALERAAAARLDEQWTDVLRAFDRGLGQISIVDRDGRLLARRGDLAPVPPAADDALARVARLLLSLAMRFGAGEDAASDTPRSPVESALSGVPAQATERMGTLAGMPVWMLGSAHPIWTGDRVAGALLLEDTTVARLSLAQRALERLTLLVAAALAATALALLTVATLAVSRIVRLRRAAEVSIDGRGRVRAAVPRFRLHDEVDALAASYNRVLERLHEHQDYLTRLRSRLVHELRTPIMVVRSSLDNLAAEKDPGRIAAYAQRAQAGAARLERIVASMGEASSLEAMLEDSDLETVDLVALVAGCVEGYRSAYPGVRLRLQAQVSAAPATAAPEAIAQALDKLVANAVDFATPGSEIVVGIGRDGAAAGRLWRVSVADQGPALPAEMADSLFESMVSVRGDIPGASDQRGHLGLGLYLVRLIAEFHGGTARARNVDGGVEVSFTVATSAPPANDRVSQRPLQGRRGLQQPADVQERPPAGPAP